MKNITLALLLVLSVVTSLRAQAITDTTRENHSESYVGGFGLLGENYHTANFQMLPGVPNCCPRFERGTDFGFSGGLTYGFRYQAPFFTELRVGYASHNALLSAEEPTTVIVNDQLTAGKFRHEVDASIGTVQIAPLFGYRVSSQFNVFAGLAGELTLSNRYSQRELLIDPANRGVFKENGRRIRNEQAGDTPDHESIFGTAIGGIQFDLPLNAKNTMHLRPELALQVGLTPLAQGLVWRANSLQAGISILYELEHTPPPEPPIVVVAAKDTAKPQDTVFTPPVKHPVLQASVNALQMDSNGVLVPLRTLTIEEYMRTQYRPLLNYVFFDQNSASIPERYHLLTANEASEFQFDRLTKLETLPLYYEVLNIIGKRLRTYPKATVRIVGCNADQGIEKNNRGLSRQRAEAVRKYLSSTWSIDPKRITVDARNLPSKPSTTTDADGIEENRRAELYSDDPHITEPIFSLDTVKIPKPSEVHFEPHVKAEAGIDRWDLLTNYSARKLKDFFGRDTLPNLLSWDLDKERETTLANLDTVAAVLTVTDRINQSVTADELDLPVYQYTLQEKHRVGSVDTIISRYSLILFDFDQSTLSPANQRIADFVKERISPDAKVNIFGYTDRTGNDEYNKALSYERALTTQRSVNASNAAVEGLGRSVLLYDNNLPEGRFYSRTVTVIVSTPTKRTP